MEAKVDAHLYLCAEISHGVHGGRQMNLHMQRPEARPEAKADARIIDDFYNDFLAYLVTKLL